MKSETKSFLRRFSLFGLIMGLFLVSHTLNAGNAGDFDGDGKADILWQKENGKHIVKLMDGSGEIGYIWVGGPAGWNVEAINDFNDDNMSDILWRKDTGACVIWLMDETGQTDTVFVGGKSSWSVESTDDFDGDGKADILWKKDNNAYTVWTIDESGKSGYIWIGEKEGWKIQPMVAGSALLKKAKETGQTKSYDSNGSEVTDGSLKDDGFYEKGVTPSYSRNNDIVTDNITGLEWQDDAAAATVEKTWEEAGAYCAALPLDGGGWRLPTVVELQGIVVDGTYNPSIDTEVFTHYNTSDYYWSSTNHTGYSTRAWRVLFYNGYTHFDLKESSFYVCCVRGGERFTRDTNGIVTDTQTHLQWQDDYSDNTGLVKIALWKDAISYCDALSLDGGEWRLPNKKELLGIVDYDMFDSSISSVFQKTVSELYWSSTSYARIGGTTGAWAINFNAGETGNDTKATDSDYVRCVRGGE